MKKEDKSIIGCQVNTDIKDKFSDMAKQYGGTSFVLRELITGFAEGRVKISPPIITNGLFEK